MKKIFYLFLAAALLSPALSYAQLGNLKDKAKNAAGNNKSSSTPANNTSEKPSHAASSESAAPDKGGNRDEYGVLRNDPAIEEFVKDKNAYYTTNATELYRYLNLQYRQGTGHFIKRVVADTEPEALKLTVVHAKQNSSGPTTEVVVFKKLADNQYVHEESKTIAAVQADNSILMFSGGSLDNVELLVKDEAKAKATTADELRKMDDAPKADFKAAEKAKADEKNAAGNINVYKTEVKASHSDAALESKFLKLLNAANAGADVKEEDRATWSKILLKSSDWAVEKNDLGQPVKQSYVAWGIGKYTKGSRCFYHKVYFKKDYLGGGQYSDVKFDEAQRPSVIPCEEMK